MMVKSAGLLLSALVILAILSSGCTTSTDVPELTPPELPPPPGGDEQPIGGQTDSYGCLGPAGYAWDADVGACTRPWELNEDQAMAAGIAVDYVGYVKPTTITAVSEQKCPGCFSVTLEQGEDRERIAVQVTNWEAEGKTVLYHKCTDAEKAAEICTMEYLPVCGYMADGTSETYGNACGACSAGSDHWENGEC